jgi:hypothetical protein
MRRAVVLALAMGLAFWAGRMGRTEKLLRIYRPGDEAISYSTFRYLRGHTQTLANLTGYAETVVPLEGSQVVARFVAGDYFGLLGQRALVGRTLQASDESTDHIVLSEEVWKRCFGGTNQVVGRRVQLGSRSAEVVGVAALREADVWVPMTGAGEDSSLVLYGKTKAGVSPSAVQAEFTLLLAKWATATNSIPVTEL